MVNIGSCIIYSYQIVLQEEHKNQGAWSYVQPRLQTALGGYGRRVQYIGREVNKYNKAKLFLN